MEFDLVIWVVGWIGLWVQSFYFGMGWVGLGQSFGGLGWVEEIGPADNSVPCYTFRRFLAGNVVTGERGIFYD